MELFMHRPYILELLQKQTPTPQNNMNDIIIPNPIRNTTDFLPEVVQHAEFLKTRYTEIIGNVFESIIRPNTPDEIRVLYKRNIFESPIGKIPSIPIKEYMIHRINRYAHNSYYDIIHAVALIDKINMMDPTILPIRKISIHRIYATALLLAIKLNMDKCYCDTFYANVIGITRNELISLEIKMFKLLDFNVMIDENILMKYIEALNKL